MTDRKHIYRKSDRKWRPSKIPHSTPEKPLPEPLASEAKAEAFACDWTRNCEVCGDTPVVNGPGMCGPCTFGEAKTAGGNW